MIRINWTFVGGAFLWLAIIVSCAFAGGLLALVASPYMGLLTRFFAPWGVGRGFWFWFWAISFAFLLFWRAFVFVRDFPLRGK